MRILSEGRRRRRQWTGGHEAASYLAAAIAGGTFVAYVLLEVLS